MTVISIGTELLMELLGLYLVYLFWLGYRHSGDRNLFYLAVFFTGFFVADVFFSLIIEDIFGVVLPGVDWHEIFIIAILGVLVYIVRRTRWREAAIRSPERKRAA